MVLVFQSLSSYNSIRNEILCTPNIEGGVGPVMLQEIPAIAADGRCAIEYAWSEVDKDWLEAYTSGENPAIIFTESLPSDWYEELK